MPVDQPVDRLVDRMPVDRPVVTLKKPKITQTGVIA
jgi:hypothetical protein